MLWAQMELTRVQLEVPRVIKQLRFQSHQKFSKRGISLKREKNIQTSDQKN